MTVNALALSVCSTGKATALPVFSTTPDPRIMFFKPDYALTAYPLYFLENQKTCPTIFLPIISTKISDSPSVMLLPISSTKSRITPSA